MARTPANSQKKPAASVRGRKPVGEAPPYMRNSPLVRKVLNRETGEEKEDLVSPVVTFAGANPPVVLELSPEFENEARHDLGVQVLQSTEEKNENGDNIHLTMNLHK
jgi:hypothetical protein